MKMKRQNARMIKVATVISFISLYIFCMAVTTYLEQDSLRSEVYTDARKILLTVKNEIERKDFILDDKGAFTQNGLNYIQYVLNNQADSYGKHRMIAISISDFEGNVIAKSSDKLIIHIRADQNNPLKDVYHVIRLEDYFTEAEMNEIISYFEDEYTSSTASYGFSYYYDYEQDELIHFYVKDQVTCDTVFKWANEDYLAENKNKYDFYSSGVYNISLPKLCHGKEYWEKWRSNEFLQDFNEGISNRELDYDPLSTSPAGYIYNREYAPLELYGMAEPDYTDFQFSNELGSIYINSYRIQLNTIFNPRMTALENLQDVYLYTAASMILCMIIVLYIMDKTYKKQTRLEECRRDFTNAIAHELKTPLAIVRGLAENLEIEESADLRNSFTRSIVGQTEVMDQLVEDMLLVSKMDEDNLALQKENLSVSDIVEEQIKKLEYPIEGKNLQIQYWKDEDFVITGDKSYVEKAVFNILENAVAYNREDGKISIHYEKDNCMIENTGNQIPDEDLPHVCDMFFTGNKSRSSDGKHKGLGLYLAKRIFDMHGVKLEVSNTDIGVSVKLNMKG